MVYLSRLSMRAAGTSFPIISAWWTIVAACHSIAILLVVRRLSGALIQPLSGWGLIAVSALVVASSTLVRRGALELRLPMNETTRRILAVSPTIAGLLVIASVTLTGSSLFPTIAAWGMILAAETAGWMKTYSSWRLSEQRVNSGSAAHSAVSANSSLQESLPETDHTLERDLDRNEESLPAGVTQQLTRSRHAAGETLAGLLRVDFAAEERTQVVHVVFCPAFETVPAIDVAQVSGPTVSVQVTQVETFGVRLEVKHRQSGPETCSIVLEIEAAANRTDP